MVFSDRLLPGTIQRGDRPSGKHGFLPPDRLVREASPDLPQRNGYRARNRAHTELDDAQGTREGRGALDALFRHLPGRAATSEPLTTISNDAKHIIEARRSDPEDQEWQNGETHRYDRRGSFRVARFAGSDHRDLSTLDAAQRSPD